MRKLHFMALAYALFATWIFIACVSPAIAKQENCQKIKAACQTAGFVQGGGKKGNSLKKDCIAPLLAGSGPNSKTTIPLPQIDAATIAACKTENPNFGGNKSDSAAPASTQGGSPKQP